jgi:hypothetical protein
MTRGRTLGRTRGLVALFATLALLVAGLSVTSGAQAAISKAAQANKAAGQASFFCLAWQCQSRTRRLAVYSGTTLVTRWHFGHPRNMIGHPKCRTFADVLISVTSGGTVRSNLLRCG